MIYKSRVYSSVKGIYRCRSLRAKKNSSLEIKKNFPRRRQTQNSRQQLISFRAAQHEQDGSHAACGPELPPPSFQNSPIHILPETPPSSCGIIIITTMPIPQTVLPLPRPQGSHGHIAGHKAESPCANEHAITVKGYDSFGATGGHGPLARDVRETDGG